MLKTLFVVYIALLCFAAVQAQTGSDREEIGLRGDVRTVREFTAEVELQNGRIAEKRKELDSLETFDPAWRRISYASYSDGKILYRDSHFYDAAGRLVEKRTVHDRLMKLCYRKIYLYEQEGRLIEEQCFLSEGRFVGKRLFRYGPDGLLVEEESLPLEGGGKYFNPYVTRYRYDAAGRQVERSTLKNTNEGWVPEDFRLGYYKITLARDERGNISERHKFRPGDTLYSREVSRYDEKGNEIETITYSADGTVKEGQRYEYEFDRHGNWIRETMFELDVEEGSRVFRPSEVTYRKITYYSKKPFQAKFRK